jgi:hypothetical protein
MKLINYFFRVIINTFFLSATPNLFGSKRRREEKLGYGESLTKQASETQKEIDLLKVQNPFESAAAKSAMAESTRRARQTQQRFANVMGGDTNPEALVAAQQATQEAVAGTAGDIAVGAEAQKKAEIAQLRGIKAQKQGQSIQARLASTDEWGAGWRDLFSGIGGLTPMVSGSMQGGSAAVAQ